MNYRPTNTSKKRKIWLKLFLSIIGLFVLLIIWWIVFCISRFSCADDIPTRIELWSDILLTKLYPHNVLIRYMATKRRFWNVYYPHCWSDTNGGKYIANLWIKNAEKLIQLWEGNQWSYFSEKNRIAMFPVLLLTSDFEDTKSLLKSQEYIKNISIDQFYLYAWLQYLDENTNEEINDEKYINLEIAENYILKALSIHKYPVYYDALKEIHLSMGNIDAAIEDSKNFINLVQSWYIIYNYPKELLDKYEDTSKLEFKDGYLYQSWYNEFLSLENLADLHEKKWDYTEAIKTLHLAEDWANSAIWEECPRYIYDYPRHCSLDEESSLESWESIYKFTELDNQRYIQNIEERIDILNAKLQNQNDDLSYNN